MKPYLVLCLGNEVLSDDAVGAKVAEKLHTSYQTDEQTEIIFAPLAGFQLLDFLNERRSVLIVDSIITGRAVPGTIHFMPAGHLTPSNGLINSHQISLPTALQLGKKLGYQMPETIDILAVEVQDIETLSEELTPEVAASVDDVVDKVQWWIKLNREELTYG